MNPSEVLIWNRNQDRLMNFVLRYTKDRAVAEDIVHDVFLKVHDKLPQLRRSDRITGWIFRIARNMVTDHFRRKSKVIGVIDLDWKSAESTLNDCVSGCLTEMLRTLPERYRLVLEMAEILEMSQLQIAETLKMSYSGTKSRVQRARQMLKKKMDQAYQIQFDAYGNAVICKSKTPCGCD